MEKFNLLGYRTFVRWSDEDECYLASVPALPGCMAHGQTQQECVAMAANAILEWLETATELGRLLPEKDALAFA